MAEPDSEMEEHRYSHLMSATQKREFRETFVLFDYDGGGDVDLRELGMMLRKLGQAPSDAELAQMINDFDYDKSGTIDIEEFCGMMLASVRAAAVPKWLVARCDPPEGEDQLDLRYEPGESGSLRRPLSLDQQLFVIDEVALVQEHNDVRHTNLTTEQNVLFRLRHRAVRSRNHQNRTIHLGGTGDHVLDKVSVAGAVNVSIVTVVRLVLNVCHCDRHCLGIVTYGTAFGDVRVTLRFG